MDVSFVTTIGNARDDWFLHWQFFGTDFHAARCFGTHGLYSLFLSTRRGELSGAACAGCAERATVQEMSARDMLYLH